MPNPLVKIQMEIDTPEAARLLAEYDDLAETIDNAKGRLEELKSEIVAMCKDKSAVICGREAQAADPEADALFALLDALRNQFNTAEFTAKDVQSAANGEMIDTPLETALFDLAGNSALNNVRSLGKILKFREGRIVHGLRLIGRTNGGKNARVYRVQAGK